jgi:hypothetical protein
VTTRCIGGRHLLRPDPGVAAAFEYLLAVAADRFAIELHEFISLSNHYHLLLTDVDGRLPDFMHFFNTVLARWLNARYGTMGPVFETYHLLVDEQPDRVVQHASYILANPCTSNLVRRSSQWIAASSRKREYGRAVPLTRPTTGLWTVRAPRERKKPIAAGRGRYFRRPSTLPGEASLRITRPRVYDHLSDGEVRKLILAGLRSREIRSAQARSRSGAGVLGIRGVLATPRQSTPDRSVDPLTSVPSQATSYARGLAPRADFRAFVERYRATLNRFRSGCADVIWPLGTWLMRRRYGLPIEPLPLAA